MNLSMSVQEIMVLSLVMKLDHFVWSFPDSNLGAVVLC
jgi:hypothetical protein